MLEQTYRTLDLLILKTIAAEPMHGSEWAVSENNRRAKYYTLAKAGRKALEQEAAQWERLSTAIPLVVRTA